jgi:Flp pilus assembly protein TadD
VPVPVSVASGDMNQADVAAAAAAEAGRLHCHGQYAEAEQLLRRAVQIYQDLYGPDDARLASPLSALGATCAARGRLAEAERLYRRALSILGGS